MRIWLALFLAFAVGCVAKAAPPLEVYGRLPAVEAVSLSPSGEKFALVARDGAQRRLFVRKADGTILVSAPLGNNKIRGLEWGGDDHLFIIASVTIDAPINYIPKQEWRDAIHLDLRSGKTFMVLGGSNIYMPAIFGWAGSRQIGGKWYLFVEAYTHGDMQPRYNYPGIFPNLVRIDLDTKEVKISGNPAGKNTSWLLNKDGEVIARGDYDEHGKVFQLIPGAGGQAPLVVSKTVDGEGKIKLMGQGRDPSTVLLSEESEDSVTMHEVNLADGKSGPPLSKGDNTANPLLDVDTGLLIGLSEDEGSVITMFDTRMQKRVDAARKAFPGLHTGLVSYGRGLDRMVIWTGGGQDVGTYWLVDIAKRSAIPIGSEYPEIKEADVGPSRMFAYKAADGLAMEGALSLPPGREAKNLPLVVLPHGGPLVGGDQATFDWWTQAFVSRGYAVFRPNYRGTLGYGEAFRKAAYGEFGKKMQTDISDGVSSLAKEGLIDPKRACIVGASYGGYAALAGVTIQQGLYRCAVSLAGPSDMARLIAWVTERHGEDQRARSFWKAVSGASNGQNLADIAPARLAARADAPILLIHGKDDTVVPIEQSLIMERALKAAGKPVEFVSLPGEDHWLSSEATRQAMLAAAVAFVEKHNPPR